jgi:hypothetical protein
VTGAVTTDDPARVARRRARRLGLLLTERGTVFTVRDGDITLLFVIRCEALWPCILAQRTPMLERMGGWGSYDGGLGLRSSPTTPDG